MLSSFCRLDLLAVFFAFFAISSFAFVAFLAVPFCLSSFISPHLTLFGLGYQRGIHPQLFRQTLVLTNGATIEVLSTLPKRVHHLEMDSLKHPLANPDVARQFEQEHSRVAKVTAQLNAQSAGFITKVKAPSSPAAPAAAPAAKPKAAPAAASKAPAAPAPAKKAAEAPKKAEPAKKAAEPAAAAAKKK